MFRRFLDENQKSKNPPQSSGVDIYSVGACMGGHAKRVISIWTDGVTAGRLEDLIRQLS